MVVFGCKKSGTCKGYGEREISLATLERQGGTFSGLTLLASQKWWFLVAKRVAPVSGMEKGKFLLLHSRERGGTFAGLFLLASQKWWFLVAKRVAPVGGI